MQPKLLCLIMPSAIISTYIMSWKDIPYFELPFDSTRKIMSTLNQVNGKHLIFVKGAADVVLRKSIEIHTGGRIRYLSAGDRYDINLSIRSLSDRGYRVLGLAYKEYKTDEREFEKQISYKDESSLIFLGLITLVDPPRPEAIKAIQAAKRAEIKPVMITGDHRNNAIAIAREVGIFGKNDLALTGDELERMNQEELLKLIGQVSVYARVSPEHKIKIVDAWQKNRGIVAFVGDGINDAPAIRKADIGISMGISGTEVSKEASSIILTDDNYFTLLKQQEMAAKSITIFKTQLPSYFRKCCSNHFSCLYFAFILTDPFAPVHLLFINLLTDSLCDCYRHGRK